MVHLGVIKCLEEEGIQPDIITGTSIGALIGSLYAYGIKYNQMEKKARGLIESEEFKKLGFEFFKDHKKEHSFRQLNDYIKERLTYAKMIIKPHIIELETLRNLIEKFIPNINIEDLPHPFAAVSLDLVSGNDVVIKEGPLTDAVIKSISIPGIFPACSENNKILVDGGATASVPVDGAYSLGADVVIGVYLCSRLSEDFKLRSGIAINFRVDEIAKYRLNKIKAERADVLIKPRVYSIHWADYKKIDYGIKEGYRATKEKIKEIKRLKRPSLFRRKKKYKE